MSYSDTGAGTGAGQYDQGEYDNQIVAVYDTARDAQAARDRLVQEGVPASAIEVLNHDTTTTTGTVEPHEEEGFWGALKNLFAPEDDYRDYHHALGQGHAMLVVTPSAGTDRRHVVQLLEQTDPIDFDSRVETWRSSGLGAGASGASGIDPMTAGTTGAGLAAGGSALGATTGATPGATTGAPGWQTGREPPEAAETDAVLGANRTGTVHTTGATAGMDGETLKVVQERLRVGKREVEHGGVRVRSYVVERPVEEQVRLREEQVHIERRPVDQAVTPGEAGLFQERTLEARATAEEAVVNKEARVVEEIGLRKEASERTETVRDTVRETKVDIEDQTGRTTQPNTGRPDSTRRR